MSGIAKFYSFFTIFEELTLDLARWRTIFEVEKKNCFNYLDKAQSNIKKKVETLKNEIVNARIEKDNLEKESLRLEQTGVSLKYNEEQINLAILGMND